MFRAEHQAISFIPCCDSFDGLILAFGGWSCMSGQPVNGRKQFQTVRRLETFNQTIHARQPLVFGTMVGQKLSFRELKRNALAHEADAVDGVHQRFGIRLQNVIGRVFL